MSVIELNNMVYQTQTDYDLSNFLRTYETNLHINQIVRPTLKMSWGGTKHLRTNAKKVKTGLDILTQAKIMKKLIFIKVKICLTK